MNYITFDKDRYHEHVVMENWCSAHFGPGNWISELTPRTWRGMQVKWTLHMAFGRATFSFQKPQDLAWFMLKWGSSDSLTLSRNCATI